MANNNFYSSTKQLTFSEKLIESELIKFIETKNIKYYKSAKALAEEENAYSELTRIRNEISKTNHELSLEMSLVDGSFWKCLQIIASNSFEKEKILDILHYIHKHTDDEKFELLSNLSTEKLFKYILIGSSGLENNIEQVKARNRFIQTALSYLRLKNLKTDNQINIWEKQLEKEFINDEALAKSYHDNWKYIDNYFNSD